MLTPPALAYSTDNCTIGRAMEILGERWTFVVLREVFNGIRRFDDMRRHTGIPRQVLTNRLACSSTRASCAGSRTASPASGERHEYRLTEKGFDLYPVMVAVAQWGDRYLADAGRPARRVRPPRLRGAGGGAPALPRRGTRSTTPATWCPGPGRAPYLDQESYGRQPSAQA